jgi:hypothetical protein
MFSETRSFYNDLNHTFISIIEDHPKASKVLSLPLMAGLTISKVLGLTAISTYYLGMAVLNGIAVAATLGLHDKAMKNLEHYGKEALFATSLFAINVVMGIPLIIGQATCLILDHNRLISALEEERLMKFAVDISSG